MAKMICLTRNNYRNELKSNELLRSETIQVLIWIINSKFNNLIPPIAENNPNKFENFDSVTEEIDTVNLDWISYKVSRDSYRFKLEESI
ncbi:MAG: hypothetical protein ACD_49C00029G0041 [uncultured bacterium (gcode 4)]|uniref:Uncharacterized protein n=1 Tax=uncultured bacterium (gcode 4) TaxID=1234023 RepID=K2BCY1_9BACT|nr:MAG: hypothetical protein ACD_49C00029G0041 [uncultured bacterium (gcode 4)]